ASAELPSLFEGVLIANELLDAMPKHQVIMREDGLREVYVVSDVGRAFQARHDRDAKRAALQIVEGPLSTPALQDYLDRLRVTLEPGWRAEINLAAVEWIRDAARRLRRGFMILIDYGHDA